MPLIVVKAKVAELAKQMAKEKGMNINNVSEDFAVALDKKVKQMIEEALVRAKENNRRTVMGKDV
jgi:histone H3/H4